MKNEAIETEAAPAAIGPYSQAVGAGGWIFLSGQIGLDPATGTIVDGGVTAEARRAFDNLSAVAQAGGATLADVVKLTIYLVDLADFAAVNQIMRNYFDTPYPARATVGVVALPRGARIEVEAVIAK